MPANGRWETRKEPPDRLWRTFSDRLQANGFGGAPVVVTAGGPHRRQRSPDVQPLLFPLAVPARPNPTVKTPPACCLGAAFRYPRQAGHSANNDTPTPGRFHPARPAVATPADTSAPTAMTDPAKNDGSSARVYLAAQKSSFHISAPGNGSG